MERTETVTVEPRRDEPCERFPEFKRPNYFRGQLLGPREFQGEQRYWREKLRLHNRCLHGYGVVCGLEVTPLPLEERCEDTQERSQRQIEVELTRLRKLLEDQAGKDAGAAKELAAKIEELCRALEKYPPDCPPPEKRTRVRIACGLALDCEGNELIVRRPIDLDLWGELSEDDRKALRDGATTLYVRLCYCEQPIEPVRPVIQAQCGLTPACEYGWTWEGARVRVSTHPPPARTRCNTCCGECDEECVLLAAISGFKRGEELKPDQIDNGVRRTIATYPLTVVTGISWTHGGAYTVEEARELLSGAGVVLEFSRPVRSSTVKPGVVDIWIVEGGLGRSGNIYNMAGAYAAHSLDEKLVKRIVFRQTTRESLQYGDRAIITLRSAFLLDECCRAVSGAHLGGRVPILKEYRKFERGPAPEECIEPPNRPGAWTTGGAEGSTFESWFFVKNPDEEGKK